jgi:hypothetical protein
MPLFVFIEAAKELEHFIGGCPGYLIVGHIIIAGVGVYPEIAYQPSFLRI